VSTTETVCAPQFATNARDPSRLDRDSVGEVADGHSAHHLPRVGVDDQQRVRHVAGDVEAGPVRRDCDPRRVRVELPSWISCFAVSVRPVTADVCSDPPAPSEAQAVPPSGENASPM
jgi:hypothetical protein